MGAPLCFGSILFNNNFIHDYSAIFYNQKSMNLSDVSKIKEIIKEFFQKTSLDLDLNILTQEDTVFIKIKTDQPKYLIGQNGQTLDEAQKLLKNILKKQIGEFVYVDLDINDYKKKRIEYLKETARDTANEVVLTGKERILNPMSPYERRVIHMELAQREGICTESMGQDQDRRIIIKPSN